MRSRPDYDALGIRMGSFTIFPSIMTTIAHDDNVFARPKNDPLKAGDMIYKFKPEAFAKSNWSTHSLTVYGSGEFVRHGDFDQYDHFNGVVGADGIVEVSRNLKIGAGAKFEHTNEDFGTGESFTRYDKPVASDSYTGYLSANVQVERMRLGVLGSARRYDYDNTTNNGALVDQKYRNHDTYEGAVRVGYEVSPSLITFVQGSIDKRDYDTGALSSSGWKVIGGVETAFSKLIRGELFAGYFNRDFDNTAIKDVSGLTYGASLYWYATPLLTVGFNASHEVNETGVGGNGSYQTDILGVRADYELLRYLILTGRLSHERDDYNDTNRLDKVLRSGVSLTYLVNRNIAVSADYNHTNSDSTNAIANYARDVLGMSVKVQY